jgi:hypothetical protein
MHGTPAPLKGRGALRLVCAGVPPRCPTQSRATGFRALMPTPAELQAWARSLVQGALWTAHVLSQPDAASLPHPSLPPMLESAPAPAPAAAAELARAPVPPPDDTALVGAAGHPARAPCARCPCPCPPDEAVARPSGAAGVHAAPAPAGARWRGLTAPASDRATFTSAGDRSSQAARGGSSQAAGGKRRRGRHAATCAISTACPHPGCGLVFAQRQTMRRHHRERHEGRRDFPCLGQGCVKLFAQKSHRDGHLLAVHGLDRDGHPLPGRALAAARGAPPARAHRKRRRT